MRPSGPRPGVPGQDPSAAFAAALEEATPMLRRYCRTSTRRAQDAEDLFQRVSLRAWRGYATFRGESSFATWVMRIARNEAARFGPAAQRRREREPSLEGLEVDAADVRSLMDWDTMVSRVATGAVCSAEQLLHAAVAAEYLREVEAAVLLARFTDPDRSWAEIGEPLGMKPATCSVVNGRGWRRLRVFVFVEQPDLLGRDVIERGFRAARGATEDALTDGEAEVFDHVVLRRERRYRKQGWHGRLETACDKVAEHCKEVLR